MSIVFISVYVRNLEQLTAPKSLSLLNGNSVLSSRDLTKTFRKFTGRWTDNVDDVDDTDKSLYHVEFG